MKTQIISIMSQKGGVGKSTITNSVILDLSMKLLLKNKRQPRILLIDGDAQASVYLARKEEVTRLQIMEQEGKEFKALNSATQAALHEMRRQLFALKDKVGWNVLANYEIFRLDMENIGNSLEQIMALVTSGEYGYIFIDMPGTLYQGGAGELFELIEHLIVPVQISRFDKSSTKEFFAMLGKSGLIERFKTVKFVFNEYQIIRKERFDEIERELLSEYGVPFVKTRIKESSVFSSDGYNTLIPTCYRVNLNTNELTHNERLSNIGDFTSELLQLLTK